jgi:hypothetical protein
MQTVKKTLPFPGIRLWLILLAAPFLPVPASAQTAARLDAVLDAERVSYAQAAAIVLPAAALLAPEAGEAEAFDRAREWLPRRAERDGPVTMGELSHLVMRSFKLSGGFLYALFPGKRYAYRALAWRRLLPPNPDPGRFLTGAELLYITSQALAFTGDQDAETEDWLRLNVEQGQGLSTGAEDALPYEGEFEVD